MKRRPLILLSVLFVILKLPTPTFASTPTLVNLPSALPSGNPVVDTIWFRYFPANVPAGVRAPAVVILPPLGSGETDPLMTDFAEYLAGRGIASAVMALPYHGRRHTRGDAPAAHFVDGNLPGVVHNFQQSVSDAGTVASWLQARPEVDPTRLGIVGVSLGAIVAHLAMGLDPRFAVGVAILGGGDLPDIYRHSLIAGLEQLMHPHHYTDEQLKIVAPVDPLTYADRNRPRRVLMIEAARDMLVPPRDATELWNALGRPPIRWIDTNHMAISLAPRPSFDATATEPDCGWAVIDYLQVMRGAQPETADTEVGLPTRKEGATMKSGQRVAVPSYFRSGPFWQQLEAGAPTVGIVIVNPASGPGTRIDEGYVAEVKRAQGSGIKVLGYVATSYGRADRMLVAGEIATYFEWYGVDGIFLDEASAKPGDLDYYSAVSAYIRKGAPGAVVVLNPGTTPDEGYMAVADIVITFEGNYADYAAAYVHPEWMDRYSSDRFWHLVYGAVQADQVRTALSLSKARNAGWIYVTPLGIPNPWKGLPDSGYWRDELSIVAAR